MPKFFRAFKRAADKLDKTVGFSAPPGTEPFHGIGDALGEAKHTLVALDEDLGLAPKGAYAARVTAQNGQSRELNSSEGTGMSDAVRLAQVITEYLRYSSSEEQQRTIKQPEWMRRKTEREIAAIVSDIQRVIAILGGTRVVTLAVLEEFEQTTAGAWEIRNRVHEPDRRSLVDGFTDAVLGQSADHLKQAHAAANTGLLIARINERIPVADQRSVIARLFGVD